MAVTDPGQRQEFLVRQLQRLEDAEDRGYDHVLYSPEGAVHPPTRYNRRQPHYRRASLPEAEGWLRAALYDVEAALDAGP